MPAYTLDKRSSHLHRRQAYGKLSLQLDFCENTARMISPIEIDAKPTGQVAQGKLLQNITDISVSKARMSGRTAKQDIPVRYFGHTRDPLLKRLKPVSRSLVLLNQANILSLAVGDINGHVYGWCRRRPSCVDLVTLLGLVLLGTRIAEQRR